MKRCRAATGSVTGSDAFGSCPFTEAGSPGEGILPVIVADNLYRLLPALIISTADKFAQLPWKARCRRPHGWTAKATRRISRTGATASVLLSGPLISLPKRYTKTRASLAPGGEPGVLNSPPTPGAPGTTRDGRAIGRRGGTGSGRR